MVVSDGGESELFGIALFVVALWLVVAGRVVVGGVISLYLTSSPVSVWFV